MRLFHKQIRLSRFGVGRWMQPCLESSKFLLIRWVALVVVSDNIVDRNVFMSLIQNYKFTYMNHCQTKNRRPSTTIQLDMSCSGSGKSDSNCPQWTLYSQFKTAILINDHYTAECLLKRGLIDSDTVRFGETPALCKSCQSGNYELVRLLITHGCNIEQTDGNGDSALHLACRFRNKDIALLLIQHNANVNVTNRYGFTPLHLAIQENLIDFVQLLVESGASLEKRNCNGQTALQIACAKDNLDIVKYLVTNGSNVNVTDQAGNTPLLTAIESSYRINVSLVKVLLTAGADPNQSNKLFCNPLLSAIRRSSEHLQDGQETVQVLIDFQCDVNAHEYQSPFFGESALNLAITRNQDSITEKLIRSGAKVDERSSITGELPFVRLAHEDKTDLAKLALACSSSLTTHLDVITLKNEYDKITRRDVELSSYIFREQNFFPKLKQLSRAKFRNWLGRNADRFVRQLQLPITLRKYLLLDEL